MLSKNKLSGLPGCALKVSVGGLLCVGWWYWVDGPTNYLAVSKLRAPTIFAIFSLRNAFSLLYVAVGLPRVLLRQNYSKTKTE